MRVFHKHVHGRFERTQRTFLLEHPREHGLAGEIKRTDVTREFRMLAAHALGGPANRRFQLAVGVDELLQRPVQRARRGRIHHGRQEFVRQFRRGRGRTVAVEECLVKNPMHAFETWLHAEIGSQALEAFHRERIAVRQCDLARLQNVGDGRGTFDIDRVTLVELLRLCRHARERMTVHVGRIGGNMRNAARGETGDNPLREQRKICQRQESAIALTKRGPTCAPEFGTTQMLEITNDRIGEEALQKRGTGLAVAVHALNHMRIDTRRTPSTTLIRQHHTEMLDGLLNPTIGTWTERTRTGTTGTTLQEHEQRKIIMHMFGSGDHTVEQADRFAIEPMTGLVARPIQRHLDGTILNMQSGHVVFAQQRHAFTFPLASSACSMRVVTF